MRGCQSYIKLSNM